MPYTLVYPDNFLIGLAWAHTGPPQLPARKLLADNCQPENCQPTIASQQLPANNCQPTIASQQLPANNC
ncbi:hypothetical protein BOX15_Mlig027661g2 [Macrostomum lignano]|uniref:Uncharacterized protein n=1 Tax=Macrostomum lignano TaxID=282301 RepID=A0A267G0E3_9PLAT|nr:hypothetical protein BOX15_Mlig027661g1 [Macrostomum lignano]PAA78904.1 hypothetical protein BOX15_Mlig027661g2 [Macrostomum lignano]